MKLNPSPIKLNGDADDSNPHWSWRLSVAVGDWHRSRSLSIAVGDRCQSWHLSITVGDQRRSRRWSVVVGADRDASTRRGADGDASARRWRWRRLFSSSLAPIATLKRRRWHRRRRFSSPSAPRATLQLAVGDASARHWRRSLLEASSKMVSHFNSSSSSSSTPSFVFLSCFSIIFRSKSFVLCLLWYCFYYVLDDRNSLDFRFSEMGFCFCY